MTRFPDIKPTTQRVVIEAVTPSVDDGRFAAKRIVGDRVTVEADVFGDGHDHVSCGRGGWRYPAGPRRRRCERT